MGSPINSALASAHAALNHANGFTKSVEGHSPSAFAPKAYSHVPYSAATTTPSPSSDIGKSLAWKAEQAKVANPQ